ncbi:MAG TPA: competence/damage-inducible protein A [Bacteroidales bacterium]|nr:competence/damage-inducible protein A [Bacteroidales bacterium]
MSTKEGYAEIISIGDELLIGQVINSNAAWMGEQLFSAGIALRRVITIGDNEADLHEAIDAAISRSQFVLLTGGLGPTSDDITKPALCSYFKVPLVWNQEAYLQVEALFARRGMSVSEKNRQQAMLPANCIAIPNPNGTAPGMWFEHNDSIIVSMPGVPFEMKPMLTNEIIPRLRLRFAGTHYFFRTVMTTGAGESAIAERLKVFEMSLPGQFKLAYLPQPGIVRLRLGVSGTDSEHLMQELNRKVDELVALLPDLVYGFDNEMPEETVSRLLKAKNLTLGMAESCTGGYLAHLFTSLPGSSAIFKGSIVAYANEAKTALLGVDQSLIAAFGAVSKEVAVAMAQGARSRLQTDYAIGITGIAGPDGGTPEKPVGTVWIALAGPDHTVAEHFLFGDKRDRNIRRSALAAINMLHKALRG